MFRIIISIAFIVLTAQQLFAQPDSGIFGRLQDAKTGEAISFANIIVFSEGDSVQITGTASDERGRFRIKNLRDGRYDFLILVIGYEQKRVNGIEISPTSPTSPLGVIKLEPTLIELESVEAVAERSHLELKFDKKIFSVGKDLGATGNSAAEVLDNIPSVTVDMDGSVSLRGSSNLRVLVDGKRSALTGMNGTSALEQLPANMIDRVEVVTNPSARYEADGVAGVINIILRKDSRRGLNGSVNVNAGAPDNYGAAFNLNHRRKKLNLFISNSLRYRKSIGGGDYFQEFLAGNLGFLDEDRRHERAGLSNSIRLGSDYFFNDKNILTGAFLFRYGDKDNKTKIDYRDFNVSRQPTTQSRRFDHEEEIAKDIEVSLAFKRDFVEEGRTLTIDTKYESASERENSDILESFILPADQDPGIEQVRTRDREKELLAKLDYTHPFAEKGKFEFGLKSNLRKIQNNFLLRELQPDGFWLVDANKTDDLDYQENIYAAYAIVANESKPFSYQIGLRSELSDVTTKLLSVNLGNNRSYLDFFPTAHISYSLDDLNAVQLSYSRRIRRPHFRLLLPFSGYSDDRTIRTGNPDLKPTYTHSMEFGYLRADEKKSLSSSVYYRYSQGVIQRLIIRDTTRSENALLFKPFNFASRHSYGLEFTGSMDVHKWLSLDGNVNFFRSREKGSTATDNFSSDAYSWFARFTSKVRAIKGYDMQFRFNYRGAQTTVQGTRDPVYFMTAGISRKIFGKRGTLAVNVYDVFNSRVWKRQVIEKEFNSKLEFQWSQRSVNISLNYRLDDNGKRQRSEQKNRENGSGGDYGGEEGF